ncbi:hypothetical protein ACFW16_33220 [Inquilinus sp. NPDC058860]|uniref:hypothetical protein n=1 Tax=Inquilinus sp. NPDC058860 TaxID=3346652 RepID=UPI0036BF7949
MERGADSDLDVQAHCRSLALQQIGMLTRIAEIGMRLVEATGAKAIAQAERPEAEQAEALRADAPATVDHGLAFARHAHTVQRALALRARTADGLCARDKAERKARRARQRDHVTEALFALIWDAAGPTRDLGQAEFRITEMHDQLDEFYGDEEDRVEDRPVGSVIAGLACGLRLSEQWHRRATDWSDQPFPPPPAGTPAENRERRRARVRDLMQHTIDGIVVGQAALRAGLEARLEEPDVEALIDAEPPMRAARRLCASLGIDFDAAYREPKQPDTG